MSGAGLPGDAQTRLQIWDFGGQDIYHSTHALFLKSPAILVLAWAEEEERLDSYEHDGLTFRNHPLAYWVEIVRHLADPASPVLIVQSKCDRPEQEVLPFPIPEEALKALAFRKQLHVSAKERSGRAALLDALGHAVRWLRDPARLGLPQIGAGRLRVQRRLEALRDADMALPREQRRHRLLERHDFEAICAEEGGVTDPALLLDYLDRNGTVFHRPGLFGDRIVLDQAWALEAIYALFDRKRVYKMLRRAGGRFTREDLGLLVWGDKSEAEQKLLLGMMRSCGICFEHRRLADDDIEYIAPDLLPERADIAEALAGRWDEDRPSEQAVFRYPLLHAGLIRTVMAQIGEEAGPDPLYWRGGLCGYETTTRSRLLIEEEMLDRCQGIIRVRTQGGQAAALLNQLVPRVERAQEQLGLRPTAVERTSPAVERREEEKLSFGQEKPNRPEWYVSYAWGDDKTPDGRSASRWWTGSVPKRRHGAGYPPRQERAEHGRQHRGLHAPDRRGRPGVRHPERQVPPLALLHVRAMEIWRTSRQEEARLRERVRVYTLGDADIWEPVATGCRYAGHWRKRYEELEAAVREHGLGALGDRDHAAFRQMREFYSHVGDILATLADIVQPRNFQELVDYGLE